MYFCANNEPYLFLSAESSFFKRSIGVMVIGERGDNLIETDAVSIEIVYSITDDGIIDYRNSPSVNAVISVLIKLYVDSLVL